MTPVRRKEVQYKSPISVPKTIEFVRDIHTIFTADKADFTAFSPKYNDPYGDNFLAKITDAENFQTDEQYIDIQKNLTASLEAKMDVGRIALQKFFNFVEDAFPETSGKLSEAGKDNYDYARQVPERLIILLGEAKEFADDNQAALTSVGYTAAMAAELSNSRDEITTALNQQNVTQKSRRSNTQARRTTTNQAYDTARDLCEDAKIIYVNNFAKYQQYLIPGKYEIEWNGTNYTSGIYFAE